jgi:hypothetical protein
MSWLISLGLSFLRIFFTEYAERLIIRYEQKKAQNEQVEQAVGAEKATVNALSVPEPDLDDELRSYTRPE